MITPFDFDRFAENARSFFFLIVEEIEGLRIDLRMNTEALKENTATRKGDGKDSDAAPR